MHRTTPFAFRLKFVLAGLTAAATGLWTPAASADTACQQGAGAACYFSLPMPGAGGALNFYGSMPPDDGSSSRQPTRALIAVHGHPRDANRTFDAALRAVALAGLQQQVLVVAPVFQVAAEAAARCSTAGVPAAAAGDLLWTCSSWLDGGTSLRPDGSPGPGAFEALDALVAGLAQRWPSLKVVTIAGFSAGAQMVQHAIGFAAAPPPGIRLRYVVSDPGSWLYFDAQRPVPPADASACQAVNRWKYGTDGLPPHLQAGTSAAGARQRYIAADVHYLAGSEDQGRGPGTYYGILDKSCAAQAQGVDRLDRARRYAAYDRTVLQPAAARPLVEVPGCAHDVACVFPSPAARAGLLGDGH